MLLFSDTIVIAEAVPDKDAKHGEEDLKCDAISVSSMRPRHPPCGGRSSAIAVQIVADLGALVCLDLSTKSI